MPVGRRPRRDARRDRRAGRRPGEDQPARAGGARDRPLGAGRRVRHRATRSRATPSASSSATPSATRSCAGGSSAFERFAVVPPDTGHRPPGQPRVPRARRVRRRPRRRRCRSPTRTRSSAPTRTRRWSTASACSAGASAGIEAEAAMLGQPMSMLLPQVVGFRLHGALPRGRDGDRPRPDGDRDAAREGRRRPLRRVLRRRASPGCRSPTARRSATCRRSSARPARSSRSTPRRCATCASPAAPTEQVELVEAYAREQGLWHDEHAEDAGLQRHARARPRRRRAEPRRPAPAPGPRAAERARASASTRRWRRFVEPRRGERSRSPSELTTATS